MTLPAPSLDHVALVTGASSGIGEEIARDLAGHAPQGLLARVLATAHPGLRRGA